MEMQKKKRKSKRPDFSNRKITRKEVKSKIGSREKTHKLENVARNPPKPYRKKQIEAETLVLDLRNYFYEKIIPKIRYYITRKLFKLF